MGAICQCAVMAFQHPALREELFSEKYVGKDDLINCVFVYGEFVKTGVEIDLMHNFRYKDFIKWANRELIERWSYSEEE